MSGWIKLHRKITTWEWWDDHNTTRLFIFIISQANHTDKKWQGNSIKRGEFITSYQKMAALTGLSIKQIRTSINRLKKTGEVAVKSTTQFTKVIVEKYSKYQIEGQTEGTPKELQGADEGQTKGRRRATTNNDKKDKNEKNVKKSLDSVESNGTATLVQYFGICFKEYFNVDYHANFGKDGRLLKTLSDQYGEDRVKKGIQYFFNTFLVQDEFAMENPNVGTLSIKWNSMIAKSSGKKALTKQQKKIQSSIENILEVELD